MTVPRGPIFSIGPDRVTAAQLAEKRQEIAYLAAAGSVPPWSELTEDAQQDAVQSATWWLLALAEVAPDWVWKVG